MRREMRRAALVESLECREMLSGTPITVMNLNSSGSGSLVNAIAQVNSNPSLAPYVITFAPALNGTIHLSSGLDISGSVTIKGPGAGNVTLDGGGTAQPVVQIEQTDLSGNAVKVEIDRLTIANGTSMFDAGGVINNGNLTLSEVDVTRNQGSGIENFGKLTVVDSVISSNSGSGIDDESTGAGNGVSIDTTTVMGNGATTTFGIYAFLDNGGEKDSVTNSSFSGNLEPAISNFGGSLSVTGTQVLNNSGTGLANQNGFNGKPVGQMTVSGSTISGNTSAGFGGGIFNQGQLTVSFSTISGNSGQSGGGIEASGGLVIIRQSTISNNTAGTTGGGIDAVAPIAIIDSTIAQNTADDGGGVNVGADAQIINTTIAQNTAKVGGGIYLVQGSFKPVFDNTIVAANLNVQNQSDDIKAAAGAPLIPGSGNLIGTGGAALSTAAGNQIGVTNPALGTLANNGGPTQTIALLAGSPAIDAGQNSLAVDNFLSPPSPITQDQRGDPRIVNSTVDVGAYEVQPMVGSFLVNNGDVQRSMVTSAQLTFNMPVVLQPGALTLTGPGGAAVPFVISTTDAKSYHIAFSGTGGSLPDGRYSLTVHAALVSDAGGAPMLADQSFNFYRLFGDFFGTGTVNNASYLKFKTTYGKTSGQSGFLAAFDYDANGNVNNLDYLQLKKRYLTVLP